MKPNLPSLLRKMPCSRLLLLLSLLLLLLFLLLLRPSPPATTTSSSSSSSSRSCNPNLPETLFSTIIHYASSNSTPQQTLPEISLAAQTLRRRSPSRFLVFGLGLDSPMWSALNHAGRTIFIEQDQSWISSLRSQFPSLQAYHLRYHTKLRDADALMRVGRQPDCSYWVSAAADVRAPACRLALRGLPEAFYEEDWDVIMVDAPTGWVAEAPGRMGAIYTAGAAARGRRGGGDTDVFVHDVDRKVEDEFSREFLCEGYLVEQVGRLRHFRIPSFANREGKVPLCPAL